jgi:hypothetical protein
MTEHRRIYQRAYKKAHRASERERERRYRLSNSDKIKEWKRRYHEKHREADNARSRAYAKSHSKEAVARASAWNKAHPEVILTKTHNRRARLAGNGGKHTAAEWLALKIKFKNRCLCCGLDEIQLKALQRLLVRDHVIPIAKGGSSDIGNIQPLCHGVGGCNQRKRDKHIDYRTMLQLS